MADLERVTASSFRPGRRLTLGDWWLLASSVEARRANSCYATGDPKEGLATAIARVEGYYAGLDQRVLFKLTKESPPGLDEMLHEAGYELDAPSTVLWRPPGKWPGADRRILVTGEPTREWLRDQRRALDGAGVQAFVKSVMPPGAEVAFATARDGVARGLAVVVEGWVVISNMITIGAERRQGWATAVLRTLLAWGRERADRGAMLQLTDDNEAAWRLYEREGFGLSHRYWYRAGPRPAEGRRRERV